MLSSIIYGCGENVYKDVSDTLVSCHLFYTFFSVLEVKIQPWCWRTWKKLCSESQLWLWKWNWTKMASVFLSNRLWDSWDFEFLSSPLGTRCARRFPVLCWDKNGCTLRWPIMESRPAVAGLLSDELRLLQIYKPAQHLTQNTPESPEVLPQPVRAEPQRAPCSVSWNRRSPSAPGSRPDAGRVWNGSVFCLQVPDGSLQPEAKRPLWVMAGSQRWVSHSALGTRSCSVSGPGLPPFLGLEQTSLTAAAATGLIWARLTSWSPSFQMGGCGECCCWTATCPPSPSPWATCWSCGWGPGTWSAGRRTPAEPPWCSTIWASPSCPSECFLR